VEPRQRVRRSGRPGRMRRPRDIGEVMFEKDELEGCRAGERVVLLVPLFGSGRVDAVRKEPHRTMLRAIGYWTESGSSTGLPDPRDFIDSAWDPDERFTTGRYLRRGQVIAVSRGKSVCRLCGGVLDARTLSDSEYAWPGGTAHYVEEHCVRLPEPFVAHAVAHMAAAADIYSRIDFAWWRECEKPLGPSTSWPHWTITVGAPAEDLTLRLKHYTSNKENRLELVSASRDRVVVRTVDPREVRSVSRFLDDVGVAFDLLEEWTQAPRRSE